MSKFLLAALILTCFCRSSAAGDEQADARAILDKAIAAHGGEAALGKIVAEHIKAKGTAFVGDKTYPWTGEFFHNYGRDKMRMVMVYEGRNKEHVEVVNGKSGWFKRFNDEIQTMSEEQVAAQHDNLYEMYVEQLLPLKGAEFRLSPIDEISVGGRKAVGILIRNEKHDAVKLYFDKESHLEIMSKRRAMNVELGREEVFEHVFSDHKSVKGIVHSFKTATYSDDVKIADSIIISRELSEQPFDDKLFAKP
jgi:hypothetical protein